MHTILIDKMEWTDGNLKIKYYSKIKYVTNQRCF